MQAPVMLRARPAMLVVAGSLLALSACGEAGSISEASTTKATGRGSASTTAGLKKTGWGKNIKVSYGKGYVRLRSDGIPNHPRSKQYAIAGGGARVPTAATSIAADDPTKAQSYDFKIPTTPVKTSKTTSAPLGSIGFMISGAVLFNPFEGDGSTVAMASNFTVKGADGSDVPFVDSCSGHPTPMQGQYHYHGLPACVASEVDTRTGPSHIIGVAFDGFPIYGARDINGRAVRVSRLDKCNGITSPTPEFPKGIYHYVLPGTAAANSSIRCFHGRVRTSLIQRMPAMGPPGGGPPTGQRPRRARGERKPVITTPLPPDLTRAQPPLGSRRCGSTSSGFGGHAGRSLPSFSAPPSTSARRSAQSWAAR